MSESHPKNLIGSFPRTLDTQTSMMAYEIPHFMFQDDTLVHYRSLGEKEGGIYPQVPWSHIAIHGIPLDTTLHLETQSENLEAIRRHSIHRTDEETEETEETAPIQISSSTKGYTRGQKPSHLKGKGKGAFPEKRERGLKRGSKKYPTKPRHNDHRRAT